MSMLSSAPVIASKPVAKTRSSTAYSTPPVRTPRGVMVSMGALRTSTRVTLSRLKVA
jgi:hypothetical protein